MDENLNQDLQKELRREALKRNWNLFKQSKLGMIGLYIVIFFLFLALILNSSPPIKQSTTIFKLFE